MRGSNNTPFGHSVSSRQSHYYTLGYSETATAKWLSASNVGVLPPKVSQPARLASVTQRLLSWWPPCRGGPAEIGRQVGCAGGQWRRRQRRWDIQISDQRTGPLPTHTRFGGQTVILIKAPWSRLHHGGNVGNVGQALEMLQARLTCISTCV